MKREENLRLAAEAHEKALKCTKKTLLRWKPDWDGAGRHYRDATKYYKLCVGGIGGGVGGSAAEEQYIAVCKESAVVHEELGQWLTAAADQEAAAVTIMKRPPSAENRLEAYRLFGECAINHRKNSNYEKCAAMYVKAAEVFDNVDVSQIRDAEVALFMEALDNATNVFIEENRGTFSEDTFRKATYMSLKFFRFNEAIKFIERQNQMIHDQALTQFFASLPKNYLCIIVIMLHVGGTGGTTDYGDPVEKFHSFENQDPKFVSSDEFVAADALVAAFEDDDSDKLTEALKLPAFKFIMHPVSIIAKKLKLYDLGAAPRKRKPAKVKKAAPSAKKAPSTTAAVPAQAPSDDATADAPDAQEEADEVEEEKDEDDFT